MESSRLSHALFGLLVIVCSSCGRDSTEIPIVRVDLSKHLGLQRAGSKIDFNISVPNSGTHPLRIKELKTSCGCTVAQADISKSIAPGDTVTIPVSWEIPMRPGEASTTVFVALEPPGDVLKYAIAATVANTHPEEVVFGKIGPAPVDVEKRIALRPFPGQPPLSVKGIETSSENIRVISMAKQGEGIEAMVQVSARTAGPLSGHVDFITNDQVEPRLRVNVAGMVIDLVDVDPEEVYLGVVSPGKENRAEVKVLSTQESDVDLTLINKEELLKRGLVVSPISNGKEGVVTIRTNSEIYASREIGVLQQEIIKMQFQLADSSLQKSVKLFFLVTDK